MRKVVVHMQTTLDGRISRPDGLFWEPFPWGDEETEYVNRLFDAADTWAMSRKLYEFVVPYWEQVAAGTAPDLGVAPSPARDEFAQIQLKMTKLVFSHTLADDPATRRVVVAGDLAAHLAAAKATEGKDIILSAGPSVLSGLAGQPGLIDEFLVVIHPALLAAGPRLLDGLAGDLRLDLREAKVFDAGAIVARYAVRGSERS